MNKYGLFFITLLCLNQVSFAADALELQRATIDDVPQLLDLYDGLSPDDAERLVVFPVEVREAFLKKAVGAGRVFVAKDTSKDLAPIVSFCKLFLVEAEDELVCIVRDELVALGADAQVQEPYRAVQVLCPPVFATDFKMMPIEVSGGDAVDAYTFNSCDTYVYYGGSYTLPAYRRHGICTQLERYALETVRPAVTAKLRNGGNLFYVCGVVRANYGGLARHRSFAQFVANIKLSLRFAETAAEDQHFMFYAFNACKPTFYMDGDKLAVKFENKNKGYGCFLCYNMHAAV